MKLLDRTKYEWTLDRMQERKRGRKTGYEKKEQHNLDQTYYATVIEMKKDDGEESYSTEQILLGYSLRNS